VAVLVVPEIGWTDGRAYNTKNGNYDKREMWVEISVQGGV